MLLVILLIQIPGIQTKVTQKVAKNFAEQWGTEVSIGRVNISFFETASLEDIYIEDLAGDTLLYADYVKADIGAFALFKQSIVLDEIVLENAYVNLQRQADSTNFNYQFIIDSFVSADTVADTTSSAFTFDLHGVRLKDVRLNFIDDSSQLKLNLKAPSLVVDFETLGLEEQHIVANSIDLKNIDLNYQQLLPGIADDTLATADETVAALDSALLNPSGFRFTVDEFKIANSQVRFKTSQAQQAGKINFENLNFQNIKTDIRNFYLAGDTLRGEIRELGALEKNSGFALHNVALDIELEVPVFSATLHEFITDNTRLEDQLRIKKLSINPATDMLAQLEASAKVEGAKLGLKDITYFTPMLDTLPKLRNMTIYMDLNAEIENNKARVSKFNLNADDGALTLYAAADASNLNNLEQVRFDLQIRELSTSVGYLEQFSFIQGLPPGSNSAGRIQLIAQAEGTPSNVDFSARLRSGLGLLETNMLYRAPTGNQFILAGNANATNFDLTPFVGDSLGLGKVSLTSKVRIDGKGNQVDVNKFDLTVSEIEYNDYLYQNLIATGSFINNRLQLVSAYEDPYLAFDLEAGSDLNDSLPLLTADINLERANLLKLNLSPDSLIVKTRITADVTGHDADDIVGLVEIRDTELIRGAQSWTMDSLVIASARNNNDQHEIQLTSDFASIEVKGKYLFKDLPIAAGQCASYYCSMYKPTGDRIQYGSEITVAAKMWDEPVIAKAFLPELEITHPLTLNAALRDSEKAFDLELNAPGIAWDSILVKNLVVNAKTVEKVMSFDVNARQIAVGQTIDIPQFRLDGKWAENSLDFGLGLAPETDSSHLALNGSLTFSGDTLDLGLSRTNLAVRGKDYKLNQDATIRFATNYLVIHNFELARADQRLAIDTRNEDTSSPLMDIAINNFEVKEFMEIAGFQDYKIQATLDGNVQLTDPMQLSAIEANLMVKNLMVDSTEVGMLTADLNKVSNNGKLDTNIKLKGPKNDIAITGFYNIQDSSNAIGLTADINSFNLTPWEPFTKAFITDLNGTINGNMKVTGSLNAPQVNGDIGLSDGTTFRLAMTGAKYRTGNEKIIIDNKAIAINKFTLYDSLNRTLTVDGQVRHKNLQDFRLNLAVDADNFQVVNKSRDMDAPFYGKLFLETKSKITGPVDDIQVQGNLQVNEATDFVMVMLSADATVAIPDYINFITENAYLQNDPTAVKTNTQAKLDSAIAAANVSSFSLSARLDVSPQAKFTIVVDPNTGDYLEVQGETNDMRIRMAPSGDIDLQGIFEVNKGKYRLSFMEVVQKNFNLKKGSTVQFSGDPLNALLNLTAVYRTEASIAPLVSNYSLTSDQEIDARAKEPVEVLMSMQGTLEDPSFSFDIIVPGSSYGTFSSINTALRQLRSNETAMFKQVFGLIVMNRFIPENSIGGAPGGGPESAVLAKVDQTLSEFLTDQLGAVTEDYLGVQLEIEVESNEANPDSRALGLQFSRSLFNVRVEVKFGGNTAMGGGSGGNSSNTNFAGTFEILYHLNERGNLNLTIFQRNDRNFLTNEYIPRQGVSLNHFKEFNTLSGLFGEEKTQRELLKSDGAVETEANLTPL